MEVTEDQLLHYGVKGMRWGVRKDPSKKVELTGYGPNKIERKTSTGETFTLTKQPPATANKLIAAISSRYAKYYNNSAWLEIKDNKGVQIGEANFWKKNDDELYLAWISVYPKHRGAGYATEVLSTAIELGKRDGFKKLVLEVPGNSLDAQHIYDKLGFKPTKEVTKKNDIWGGLTEMVYEF